MKNMIFIKDVQSNLVEEAIVVFKENVKLREENFIKKNYTFGEENALKNDLCLKEAEIIVNDCIDKIENNSKEEKLNRKIKFLKIINVTLVIAIAILVLV